MTRGAVGAVVAALAVVLSLLVATPATAAPLAVDAGASTAVSSVDAAAGPVADAGIVKSAVVGFNPENIISDALFYDGNAMSSAEIQAFLDSKIGQCQNGKCLNVLSASISSRDAWYSQVTGDLVCSALLGGTMRVSELIYRVQVACGISAKAILVTLQKEQGLTTSSAPSDWNLRAAMGASCPDTEPCDPAYSGVGPQIVQGVRQLKIYKAGRFGKQPGVNYIGYNPSASCGGTNLNIQNYATAALYNYTPYQPNAASLAAGWGLGDGCSSYGNRNFFNYYTSWFGSTGNGEGCAVPDSSAVTPSSGLYVINDDAVNARLAPSVGCTQGVRTLARNTLVAVTGTFSEWSRATFDGGAVWIRSDLLLPLAQTPAPAFQLDGTRHLFALASDGSILAYPFSSVGRWGDAVLLTRSPGLKQIIAVGDIDGDGHRDLIGIDSDPRPLLFRGDGVGLKAPTRLAVSWAGQGLVAGAGDFDGDGIGDVFTVDASGSLNLWRGDRQSGLRAAQAIGYGWGSMTALAGATDVTGDGRVDLVARSSSGALLVYAGNGLGGWQSGSQVGVGWGTMTAIATPGDFTGDGRSDLLARDARGGLHLYSGSGSGFAYLAQVGVGWQSMFSIIGPGPEIGAASLADVLRPGVGDIDGDGNPDVVATSAQGLMLYPGNGSGGWGNASVLDANWRTDDRIVTISDFTGDGVRDLGRIRPDGSFLLAPGNGSGGLGAQVPIGYGWNTLDIVFGGIDFDGDNRPDVLARNSAGDLLLYRGDGRGGWAADARVIGTGWGMFDSIFAVGDFTGDGTADVMARAASGDLWVYPTTGTGGWQSPVKVGNGWSGFTSVFSPGNFDGTGGPDVLARTPAGALWLYRGNGRGGWSGSAQVGVGWSAFTQIE